MQPRIKQTGQQAQQCCGHTSGPHSCFELQVIHIQEFSQELI